MKCSGSHEKGYIGVWPGDSDICQECGARVRVLEDGTLAKHKPRRKPPEGFPIPKERRR